MVESLGVKVLPLEFYNVHNAIEYVALVVQYLFYFPRKTHEILNPIERRLLTIS
jgi:hypothetical protein